MLESRRSYGYGYAGYEEKGYDWKFCPDEKDRIYLERKAWYEDARPEDVGLRGGYCFKTEANAASEGRKFMRECRRSGEIKVIRSEPLHFEY